MFGGLIKTGGLEVTDAAGAAHRFGDAEPEIRIRFTDEKAERFVANDPQLAVGEMYMDGRLIVETGDIYGLLALVKHQGKPRTASPGAVFNHLKRSFLASAHRRTGLVQARRNIAHHYDLDERLFRLFLDEDLNYSCAYFEHEGQSLEDAQRAKQRLIAGKLLSEPGSRVLDIGCGWGSMCLYMAEIAGLKPTGLTLSEEQARVARARAAERGAEIDIRLEDYRSHQGQYDHIVSIGMAEHIGQPQLKTYFKKVASLLDKKGTALIHSMARTKPAPYSHPFGDKYIFPGGYIPSLAEFVKPIEDAGLLIKDVEILPLHYAETTRIWRERFLAAEKRVLELYDERFSRMWEIYLAAAEASFRFDRIHVVHLLLARHQDRVPIRRGWLPTETARLRATEQEQRQKKGN